MTGAQILVKELINQGVDTVFGYPGGQVLFIYDELYKNSDRIHHVLTAHEQGAAHAADGYARASGKTGVVIATSGPGATNLVTGIANAYLDSVPMVAITGNVSVSLLGKDSFQEVDIVGITLPVVKHSFLVKNVAELEETLKEAFLIASTGRKGPVLVDIPKNVQTDEYEYKGTPVSIKNNHPKPFNDFQAAIEAINNSKKPYIYCGGGVVASGAEAEVLELSRKIDSPIGLSIMGLTAIPNSYELNLGMCGMHGKYASSMAQSEADLIIAAGVRFSNRATGNISEYTKNCSVIHIDIDNAEISKNISSKISLCGDVKEILKALQKEVKPRKNDEWQKEINEYRKKDIPVPNDKFSPRNIINLINSYCDADTVIATDVGQHQMWTALFYKFEKPRTLLTSGGLGTMGYGMGAAIGGCIARNKKRTVLITSDGSFGMNLNELATAVSQGLPLLMIILNNGTLGMVRQWQTLFYGKRYSQTTLDRKTDFPLLAEAFGAKGFRANNLNELDSVLKNIFESGDPDKMNDGPCLIDCKIDIDEMVFPMIPAESSIKNIVLE